MKISIITVVYNNELIGSAIASVLSQEYKNVEYIIVDGGSKDNTLNIINSYKTGISKIISEPDRGIYDAINKGISLSSGDIIGILNADDFFYDDQVLSRVAAAFEHQDQPDAVYSDVVFTDREDVTQIVRHYSSEMFRPWMFRFGFQPAHPTFYVKREMFALHGTYNVTLRIAGDFELLLRFMLKERVKTKYVKDIWVKMRRGGVSTSGIKSILKLNSEIIKSCELNGISTNIFLVYSKYLVKWWGFLLKSRK